MNNAFKKMVVTAKRFLGVIEFKINPGSNINKDNDLRTATPGMLNVDIPEPKMLEKGEFQCPICDRTFNSKEDYLSHAMAHHQMTHSKTELQVLLASVPYEKGFHFFTEPGKYTGITAISLDELAAKINTVPVESVIFHFQRGDYQKWLIEVIGDEELAKRIDKIRETEWASADSVRNVLFQTVQKAVSELKESLQQIS